MLISAGRRWVARPKFAEKHGVDPALVQYTLDALEDAGEMLGDVPAYEGSLPDVADRPFIELALFLSSTFQRLFVWAVGLQGSATRVRCSGRGKVDPRRECP